MRAPHRQRRRAICHLDNLAAWENETGFAIGAADQLRFNRWIAREATPGGWRRR